MKTILRFFYASAFVLTIVVGVTAVAGARFALSFLLPAKAETTEQVVLAPANDDFPPEPSLVETQPEIFDAGGTYVLDARRVPTAFADIEALSIETHEYSEENGDYSYKPIVPTGNLWTGNEFKFQTITIADREITIRTRELNGVSFKFVGYFPKYPEFEYCDTCEYLPSLKGKLTKLKNKKVIAESYLDLYVEEHCGI